MSDADTCPQFSHEFNLAACFKHRWIQNTPVLKNKSHALEVEDSMPNQELRHFVCNRSSFFVNFVLLNIHVNLKNVYI